MVQRVIQRCVFPLERRLQPLYYWMDRPRDSWLLEPEPPDRFSIRIERGWKLITDTYFNSFFECYWRRYTRLGRLRLRLDLTGTGTVLLVRRSLASGHSILDSVEFDGDREVVLEVPEPRVHHRELGALHFAIVARSDFVRLRKAEWCAEDVVPEPVSLVAGYCTFNREKLLLDNVRSLLDDPDVAEVLERVVVVDQGTSKVRDHPAFGDLPARARSKLQVVEQANFGGAGGFTRSILEARSVAGATHVLLMDDDAVIEPESVLRAAALLALAREEFAVGGQMLDMLRPQEVYEAGALVEPGALGVFSPTHRVNVGTPAALESFLEVAHAHYNAWWFFAFPLRFVDRVGLPLPLFIRGDDVEFGLRLNRAGIATATVPGLGTWHEPFYLKTGSWQSYYDLRNMLVLTSLHFPLTRLRVVKQFLRRLLLQLLSLNYFEATILCEAADDFCRGPEVLEADPRAIHRNLVALRQELAQETVPRSRCLPITKPEVPFGSRPRRAWHLLGCLLRQLTRPSPPADTPPRVVIHADHARWWSMGLANVVAVEDWHSEEHRVFRRSRGVFLRTLARGMKSALRLYRNHGRVAGAWRDSFGRLTGGEFWREYLGIEREEPWAASREGRTQRAA